jgi:hypothetical protein
MRKLRLDALDLRVETFETLPDDAPRGRGTVYGRLGPTEECFTPPCPASVNPCVTHDVVCLTRSCPTRAC